MDWIWSWKDYVFYGMCSCSGAGGIDTEPVPKTNTDYSSQPLRLKAYRLD
ncbi:Protein F53A10.2 a [Aphelenchoides avenae]|nr:Protein F53A10.2 a [Aphelenchus avenae]